MDMRFYWVINRSKQKYFDMFWEPVVSNLGNYFTKHHLPAHQKGMITVYLHCSKSRKASSTFWYYKFTSNKTQGIPITTGGYNNK